MIFVALALVWAVFLIPKALKHHDEVAKTRSVDQVSDDVRVLARREVVTERNARLVVGSGQATPVPAAPSTPGTATSSAADPAELRGRLRARRTAAAAAARRRRRVLAVLLVSDLAVVSVAAFGLVPLWAPAIPGGLTLAFLVLARVLVRREHAAWDRELVGLRGAAPVEADIESAPVIRNEQGLAVVSAGEDTTTIDVALLADVVPTTDAGSLWDPLPMTLPTYVNAPRATRSVRTIDLRDQGVSSSGRDAADSALVAESEAAAEAARDESGPTQRAVNS